MVRVHPTHTLKPGKGDFHEQRYRTCSISLTVASPESCHQVPGDVGRQNPVKASEEIKQQKQPEKERKNKDHGGGVEIQRRQPHVLSEWPRLGNPHGGQRRTLEWVPKERLGAPFL